MMEEMKTLNTVTYRDISMSFAAEPLNILATVKRLLLVKRTPLLRYSAAVRCLIST